MKTALRILHLEDHEDDAELIRLRLRENFGPECEVRLARTAPEFRAEVERGEFDLVLSDSSVAGFDGLSALELTRRKGHRVPFIFVCGAAKVEHGDRMIAAGATDYVEKRELGDLAGAIERALQDTPSAGPLTPAVELLITTVQRLSLARKLETVQAIVRRAARKLTGADGATFVLRDGDQCFYADEDAISPLWKGCRFPMSACISGWAMLNRKEAVIEDIYADPRIPHDAYRPTFVKSLVMVPIRTSAPIGAIGNYWATPHRATAEEVRLIQALADSTSIAIGNVQLYTGLEERVRERTAELEAVNRDLEAFSYSVSHDLRSPLTGISGFTDLLLMDYADRLDDTGRSYLERVLGQTQRMQQIIDDLLALARIGRAPLQRAAVDLADLTREIAANLHSHGERREVEWVVPEQLIVDGDPGLLRVVMENLLSNAWKYSSKRERARLEVGALELDGRRTIFVRDNGAGFDPKYAHKLFGVFQRLHSQDEFAGTGIGLTNVRRIVEKHGGRIWAESEVDRGATFFFTLG